MAPSAIDELAELCAKTRARIVLVTSSTDVAWLDKAVIAGVRGVVRTGEAPPVLLKAIDKVHDGELWIDRGATGRIFMEMARQKASERNDPDKSKIATLTTRERQTIAALASDASAPGKVIASRLCISEHTLRNHLTSIYTKLEPVEPAGSVRLRDAAPPARAGLSARYLRSDHSTPPVAQSPRLTSNSSTSTASGLVPSVSTTARVSALTRFFFCSGVRPSISSTRIVGMSGSSL